MPVTIVTVNQPNPQMQLDAPTLPPASASILLRSGLFQVLFHGHLVVTLVFLTPIYFFLPKRACLSLIRGLANRSLWLLRVVCRTDVEFRGLEHLPSRPFILAHKHQSMWEVLALATVVRSPAWVAKNEVMLIPLVGLWAKKAGTIFVKRGSRSRALSGLTEGCREALANGRTIIIAPEGTRNPPGAVPAYKYGVAHLRKAFDVPVVPAALNSGLFWPRWSFVRYPGTIVVTFLPEIEATTSAESFLARLEGVIEGESNQLMLAAYQERGNHRQRRPKVT